MDILFLIPPRVEDDYGYTPAAAAVLKGQVVEHGFTAKVMDLNAEIDEYFLDYPDRANTINNFFNFNTFYNDKTWKLVEPIIDEWADRVISLDPTWVGLSVFSFNSQRATRLLSIAIKIRNPKIKIVIGGSGINNDKFFAEDLYLKKIIDAYVKGDGELALVELLKGNYNFPGINGSYPQQIKDLDKLAFPNYDDYVLKTYTNKKGLVSLPITGSRGCVRNCTFCDVNSAWPRFFWRSGESIANEIKHQVLKYNVNSFRFTDSLTNGSMRAFREMCLKLVDFRKQHEFTWDGHFIIRSIKQMPPHDFDAMKNSGAGTTWIGVESGSESVRNHMKKGYTEEDMQYTMEQLDRVGVKVRLLMVVGYITETEEDFQQTMDLFNKWQKYLHSGTIEEVQLGATLNVLPRTPLADNMDKFNIINHTGHINDWICTDNPSLDYKERLRRRIILQAHVERLGYPVFEAKNYVKQMFSQWAQVSALKNTIKEPELIGSLNY